MKIMLRNKRRHHSLSIILISMLLKPETTELAQDPVSEELGSREAKELSKKMGVT
jgi:hypothetical protein